MRYENQQGNHNKYFEIDIQPGPDNIFRIYTSWGRINWTLGDTALKQHKVVFEGNIEGCMKKMAQITKKRIRNGYTQVE